MIRMLLPPETQLLSLLRLAIACGPHVIGCSSLDNEGPREGIYDLPSEAGYLNGLIDNQLLSADQECLPAGDPTPFRTVANIAVSESVQGSFTIHLHGEGEAWSTENEGVRCSLDETNEFRCFDEEREAWMTFGDYFVYGWVLSSEELFGVWLDWTVEDAEYWDCAAQSIWVAEWSAELPD